MEPLLNRMFFLGSSHHLQGEGPGATEVAPSLCSIKDGAKRDKGQSLFLFTIFHFVSSYLVVSPAAVSSNVR